MFRYKFTIEYDGSLYFGWQLQPDVPTVQGEIETAIFKLTKHRTRLHVAGRTDAGVHALGQVAHADIPQDFDPFKLTYAVNHFLKGKGITILHTDKVNSDFHARYSAKARSYVYKIINRRGPLAIDGGRAYHVPVFLDVDAMQCAADFLIGYHDFTSFRATGCQAPSPFKTLEEASFSQKDNIVYFYCRSNSFLHHQVRNMIGTFCLVGKGYWTPEQVKLALEKKDRKAGGPTAPPEGLYLKDVIY